MAIDLVSIAGAVGSSGAAMLLYNFWSSKRLERSARKSETRNDRREPEILRSLELGNAARVNELLRQGLDEVEESRKRQATEFREIKASLEDKVLSLTNENTRLQSYLSEERQESKMKIDELREELVTIHIDMRKLKEKTRDS
jgi:hypothetical protein